MSYFFATLLGIVQGLTEFLPVSSSAHLILARAFFGWDVEAFGLAFDVACHVGTLAAVLYYFRRDLLPMIAASPGAVAGGGGAHGRMVRLIVVGTIPTIIVGLLASDFIEARLRTPLVCAVALIVGAFLMMLAERLRPAERDDGDLRLSEAFAIGWGQAAALVPGMSRSGTTIAMAMLLGIRRDAAARFTFLLAIPAILGGALKVGLEAREADLGSGAPALFATGVAVSAIVGYLTVKYFLRYLASHRLDVFAYYRFALAAATLVWLVA